MSFISRWLIPLRQAQSFGVDHIALSLSAFAPTPPLSKSQQVSGWTFVYLPSQAKCVAV